MVRMALTPSTMLPLGTPLPEFALTDTVSGQTIGHTHQAGAPGLLVAFICNHCPYVVHIREELARLGRHCAELDLPMIAISANDPVSHPADHPDRMAEQARAQSYVFPYLFDASQAVARSFQAACTPEFYLFDGARKLFYRGQLDDSRPDSGVPVSGRDLRAAIDALLADAAPPADQKPSVGCNIKWRPESGTAHDRQG